MFKMNVNNDNLGDFNIKVNEIGFGKPILDEESINYSLYIDIEKVIEDFSVYFNDFMEREADDPEPDEYLSGVYIKIKNAGFPELTKILETDKELFCQIVKEELSSEFLGYALTSIEISEEKTLFVIQSLDVIEMLDHQIFCQGVGYKS
ncbi:hypothetical protein [Enterovibrio norvegicus]|uniref:hypothetical protein n=1 Tax=Enterovibrio norvegicus TaxID=188144 RepID=UPI0013D2D60D|nr:hypothetical protein [Enterovibrio norvegicus]